VGDYEIRPDARLLALRTNKGLAFAELPTGRLLARDEDNRAALMCFSHDGLRLALQRGKEINLYDVAAGKVARTVPLPDYGVTGLFGDFLLVHNRVLYSMTEQVPVWGLAATPSTTTFVGTTGLAAVRGSRDNVIVPVSLDMALFEKLVADRDLIHDALLVREGTRVRLEVKAGGNEARQRFEQQIAERQWIIDKLSDIVITADTVRGDAETVEYSRGFFGPRQSVRVQKNSAFISIQRENFPIAWRTGRSSGGVGPTVYLNEGETLQQRANARANDHMDLFKSFELPPRVLKPAYSGGLRQQKITESGLSPLIDPGAQEAGSR